MKLKNKIIFSVGAFGTAALLINAVISSHAIRNAVLPDGFTITAHTGCEGTKDNSLDAITLGYGCGADIVEFDLNFDESGTAVLSHDAPKGAVHTLDEAFRLIAQYNGLLVNVDVKATDDLAQVVATADKYGISDRIFFTGVTADFVEAVKNDAPDVTYYLNKDIDKSKNEDDTYINELIEEVKFLGATGLNINYKACTKKMVEKFHEQGLLVSVWTVNNKLDMARVLTLGCDNITTRKPSELKSLFDYAVK